MPKAKIYNPATGVHDKELDAYNSDKLGGQLPEYYATQSGLNTTNGNLTSHTSDTDVHTNTTEKNTWNNKLDASSYTATDVLTKLKTVDGVGSGLDADLYKGGVVNAKIYGDAVYTDSINPTVSLIKNIPLGDLYNHGMLVVQSTANVSRGVMVIFGTDLTKTKMVGYRPEDGGASSKRAIGYVISGNVYASTGIGLGIVGTAIYIDDIYINGTNLSIVFRNSHSTNIYSLECTIDWEVWK